VPADELLLLGHAASVDPGGNGEGRNQRQRRDAVRMLSTWHRMREEHFDSARFQLVA
jgi:hypothetical protein